jgi:hypothetical protein
VLTIAGGPGGRHRPQPARAGAPRPIPVRHVRSRMPTSRPRLPPVLGTKHKALQHPLFVGRWEGRVGSSKSLARHFVKATMTKQFAFPRSERKHIRKRFKRKVARKRIFHRKSIFSDRRAKSQTSSRLVLPAARHPGRRLLLVVPFEEAVLMMKLPKRYATPPGRGAGLHQLLVVPKNSRQSSAAIGLARPTAAAGHWQP